MIKYYPYKSDKPKKNHIITNDNKKFILVRLPPLILHIIKMSSANIYIFIGTRIMKIGLNPELIVQGSGLAGCYGIYQQ
jgi:hypothetical protein